MELKFVTACPQDLEEAKGILPTVGVGYVDRRLSSSKIYSYLPDLASALIIDAYKQLDCQPCFIIVSGIVSTFDPKNWMEIIDQETSTEICEKHSGMSGIMQHTLAYTADGQGVQLFTRESPGRVCPRPPGGRAHYSDQIWIPHGYNDTIANLSSFRYVVSRRSLLFFDLAHFLGVRVSSDVYEAHVTVEEVDSAVFQRFKAACAELNLKAIHIELPYGNHPSHLITASFHRGQLEKVIREVRSIADNLSSRKLKVTRMKIEAMLRNSLVPCSDEDADQSKSSNYFEFHVKVAASDVNELERLREICQTFGAHLSRNPSNRLANGVPLHFATLRVFKRGRDQACLHFDDFLTALRQAGFGLSNILREYTVYDTNDKLDDGWFPSLRECSSQCELLSSAGCPFQLGV